MPIQELPVHPLLRPYVHSLWHSERIFAPGDHFDILPDSMAEIVYATGAGYIAALGGRTIPLPACYVVGLLERPLRLHALGSLRAIRAHCFPWALPTLLGDLLQPAGLPGLLLVAEPLGDPTAAATALAEGAQAAADALQAALLGRVLAARLSDRTTVAAARRIIQARGAIAVDELANAVGRSPRSLRRSFQGLLGAGPKRLAQAARFERVRNSLWYAPETSLAELALQAGYADQAHMQREFRRFSGRTPAQFAADARHLRMLFTADPGRIVQDGAATAGDTSEEAGG